MKHNLFFSFFLLIHSTLSFHGPLNYQDQQHWPDFCPQGTHQSPIDLPLPSSCIQSPTYISINEIQYTPLINKHIEYINEYTFQIDTSQNGFITISIHNKTLQYNLTNIHFHLNSEHSINGKLFSSEMHLVHTLSPSLQTSIPQEEQEYNKYLVIAIIFEPSYNVPKNSFFETLDFKTRSNIPFLQRNSFLTDQNDFYYYHGSLTTPGCNEQVNWIIINNIYSISYEQFNTFKMYIESIYPKGNNRNVHPLNGRNVFYIIRKQNEYDAIYIVIGIFGMVCLIYGIFWLYRKCRKDNAIKLNEVDNINEMINNENILSIFLTCIYTDFQKRSQKPFDMFSLNIMTSLPLIICEKICISYSPISNNLDLNTFITLIKKLFFSFHFEDKLNLLSDIIDYKHKTIISKENIILLLTHLHTHIIDYSKTNVLYQIIDNFFENNTELSFTEFYRKSKSNPNLVYVFSILIDKYNFGSQKEQLQLFNEIIFDGEEDIQEYTYDTYTIDNISKETLIYENIIKHETKKNHISYINELLQFNGNVNNDLNELDYFEKDLTETVNNGLYDIEEKVNGKALSLSTYYGSSFNQTDVSSNIGNGCSTIISEENQRIKKMICLLSRKSKCVNMNKNTFNTIPPRKVNSSNKLYNNPLQSIEHSSNYNVLYCYKSSSKKKQFTKVKLIHIGNLLFYFKLSYSHCGSPHKEERQHCLSSTTEHSKYSLKRIIITNQLFISVIQYHLKKDYFQLQLISNIKQNQLVKYFYTQNEKSFLSFRRKLYNNNYHYIPIEEIYVLGQEIGYGQFGHVFKSIHRETSTTVSIKMVSKHELQKRSSMNIAYWGKDVFTFLMNCNNKEDDINDNNIVRCYEYFENVDTLYYVMEYIPHGTIKEYIIDNGGELSMQQVNDITKQMVNAISFLHNNGIIHRDIKLTNALISKGNNKEEIKLKIIDFGLSRVICYDDWIRTNSGTFHYKAPEIIFGNNYTLNADIWSLGVCVYFMIFGIFPIEEKDKKLFREKLLKDDFNFLEKILMKKPKGINYSDLGIKVMFGALVKDPNKRVNVNKLVKLLRKY